MTNGWRLSRAVEFGMARWALVAVALVGAACNRNDLSSGPALKASPPPPIKVIPKPDFAKYKGKINEVMLINTKTLADESGHFVPWCEIYNNSDETINAGGVYLSNDQLEPKKWLIPEVDATVLPPRGFVVLFLDGTSKGPDDLHANFTITPGEDFQMVINQGSNSFLFDTSTIGADEVVGRVPDGQKTISLLAEPTPGKPNAGPAEGEFIRGDANADGLISITDSIAIQKVLDHQASAPPCKDRMDVNDDGVIDDADVIYLMARLFQSGSPPPPPPYPAAGSDPTPDDLPCLRG